MRGWREPLLLSLVKVLLTPSPQVEDDPRVPGSLLSYGSPEAQGPGRYDSDDVVVNKAGRFHAASFVCWMLAVSRRIRQKTQTMSQAAPRRSVLMLVAFSPCSGVRHLKQYQYVSVLAAAGSISYTRAMKRLPAQSSFAQALAERVSSSTRFPVSVSRCK